MKILKNTQFIHTKGTYAFWLWPAVYISCHFHYGEKTLSIQFNWLNFTAVISFLSNAAYYNHPLLYSKKDYTEYLEKGEAAFIKEKLGKYEPKI